MKSYILTILIVLTAAAVNAQSLSYEERVGQYLVLSEGYHRVGMDPSLENMNNYIRVAKLEGSYTYTVDIVLEGYRYSGPALYRKKDGVKCDCYELVLYKEIIKNNFFRKPRASYIVDDSISVSITFDHFGLEGIPQEQLRLDEDISNTPNPPLIDDKGIVSHLEINSEAYSNENLYMSMVGEKYYIPSDE